MMKDQFANYVVQKIFEKSNDRQREMLLDRTRTHLHALRKYTYGKHIVARFEQLSGKGVSVSCLELLCVFLMFHIVLRHASPNESLFCYCHFIDQRKFYTAALENSHTKMFLYESIHMNI